MTTVKNIISKLQIIMKQKYPHLDGRFYANRRNSYIHLVLDKDFLNQIDQFLSEQLKPEFELVYPPKLVISTKWKHDYIIHSRSC